MLHGVGRPFPLEGTDQPGEPRLHVGIEAERLAYLAGCRAAAVGDDVGAHRSTELAVALVDILDGTLAIVSGRQVEIDVGPLAAHLGEEALEEQFHADWIDSRNTERVADGGVGGRAAPLNQDAVLAAELHNVPHDEEVAGESELGDERKFGIDLFVGSGSQLRAGLGTVAPGHALVGALAEEAVHALAFRNGITGELVAHVLHQESQPVGELTGVGDRFGHIAEDGAHRLSRTEVPFAVLQQQETGFVERAAVPDAGEHVEDLALELGRHADAVGREQWKVELAGERNRSLVAGLLFADAMPLQLDVDVLRAEGPDQTRECLPTFVHAAALESRGERTFVAAGHTNETFRVLFDLAEGSDAVALTQLGQLVPGDEHGEIAVAALRLAKKREAHRAAWNGVGLP